MTAANQSLQSEFALARSRFIDAYNDADAAVRNVLRTLGHDQMQLLAQNIECLSKLPAGPQYSKESRQKVNALLGELRQFQPLRCDIVHGKMELLLVGNVHHAIFLNVQKQTPIGRNGMLVTVDEIDRCRQKLQAIATRLAQPLKTLPVKTESQAGTAT